MRLELYSFHCFVVLRTSVIVANEECRVYYLYWIDVGLPSYRYDKVRTQSISFVLFPWGDEPFKVYNVRSDEGVRFPFTVRWMRSISLRLHARVNCVFGCWLGMFVKMNLERIQLGSVRVRWGFLFWGSWNVLMVIFLPFPGNAWALEDDDDVIVGSLTYPLGYSSTSSHSPHSPTLTCPPQLYYTTPPRTVSLCNVR